MFIELNVGLLNVEQSPCRIACQFSVVLWPIIQSSFSSGYNLASLQLLNFGDFLLSLLYSLDVASILFAIEIEREFILIIFTIVRTEIVLSNRLK
jgi:hypothetical protein